MIKPEQIIEVKPWYIICKFNNGEVRKLAVAESLKEQSQSRWVQRILSAEIFTAVNIDEVGQLYWKDAAEMKDERGGIIKCEYDLSPEFVYHNSVAV